MRILNPALILALAALLVSSCNSNTAEEKSAADKKIDYARTDSLLLQYDPQKADKRIDEFMHNLHNKYNFNGNVLVAKKGKILYENCFGWADYLHRDSLNINSQFELASVSKTLTGTAILMLMEQGKLKLNQDVKEFFPNFPYDGVTIRLLLTHRSGMMNYVYFVDGLWKQQHKDERIGITNADVMNLIAQYKPHPYSPPDKHFHYNNSNFMVLGAIIEKVSGMKYSQFMKKYVFEPAGMKHTAVYSKAEYDKIPVDVVGHDRNSWRYSVVQNFLDGPVGDKGIYSTVGDLYLFDNALKTGRLIKKETQDSAYVGRNPMIRGHFNYGYGWRIFDDTDQKVVYHTGWWHGFRHIFVRDLKNDITVVLLGSVVNGSLLQLDGLYKMLDMPVIRKGAYNGNGDTEDD